MVVNDNEMVTDLLFAEEKFLIDSNEAGTNGHHENKHTKEDVYFEVYSTNTVG